MRGAILGGPPRNGLNPDTFLPAHSALCPAVSVFFTLWEASTIQQLVCSFRPLLCRAAPTPPEWNPAWARPLAPLPEILVAGAPIGEVRGQHSGTRFSRGTAPRRKRRTLGPAAGRPQRWAESRANCSRGIGMRHDYPSPDNSRSLTYFRDRRQVLTHGTTGARRRARRRLLEGELSPLCPASPWQHGASRLSPLAPPRRR